MYFFSYELSFTSFAVELFVLLLTWIHQSFLWCPYLFLRRLSLFKILNLIYPPLILLVSIFYQLYFNQSVDIPISNTSDRNPFFSQIIIKAIQNHYLHSSNFLLLYLNSTILFTKFLYVFECVSRLLILFFFLCFLAMHQYYIVLML